MEILAIVSDLHCNSRQGLMPPIVDLNEGQRQYASDKQLWIWEKWLNFWTIGAALKRKRNAKLVVLVNGEVCDMNKYGSTELVSADPSDALRIGREALAVPAEIADGWRITYGTEAHVGVNGHLDREMARQLGAVGGHHQRFAVDDLKVDAMHHPKMNNRLDWMRGSAAARMAYDLKNKYLSRGLPVPDVAFRGHVHMPQDSGHNHDPLRLWITPSWKLSDSYVHRIGEPGESFPAPIGGLFYWKESGKKPQYIKEYYEWPIKPTETFPPALS